jgi:hypothetical protein
MPSGKSFLRSLLVGESTLHFFCLEGTIGNGPNHPFEQRSCSEHVRLALCFFGQVKTIHPNQTRLLMENVITPLLAGPLLAFGFANDLWTQRKVEKQTDDYWPKWKFYSEPQT